MKKAIFSTIYLFYFLNSFCQPVYTGSIFIDEPTYAGIAGNLPQTTEANLPASIDLSIYLPPAGDQGNQNSCVAWAIAYGAQTYYAKINNENWTYRNNSGQIDFKNIFSPSYIYNQINNGTDKGSNFIDALNLLKNQGVCSWNMMPYSDRDFRSLPTQDAKQQANDFRIERFFRLGEKQDLLFDVKEQLANSHPVIAGAISDNDYLGGGKGINPNIPYTWRTIGSFNPLMGHAILIVGYDDRRQAFKFLNSYGRNWGNDGYGWISYSIFNGVVRQAFTMKPSFNRTDLVNTVISENRNIINSSDVNLGLNLLVTSVDHMNSITHPYVPMHMRFMTVNGLLSVPKNIGSSTQIVIYYYLIDSKGKRTPMAGSQPLFKLPSGQAISATPPIPVGDGYINLPWYSTIPYSAFSISYNMPPKTYILEAEPALIVDNYPVRLGQTFRFSVSQ